MKSSFAHEKRAWSVESSVKQVNGWGTREAIYRFPGTSAISIRNLKYSSRRKLGLSSFIEISTVLMILTGTAEVPSFLTNSSNFSMSSIITSSFFKNFIKRGGNEISTVSDFLFTATHSWNTSPSSVFHRIPLLLLYLSPATCEEGVAGRSEARNSVYRLRAPFTSSRKEIALFSPKGGKVTTVEVLQ